MEQQRLARIEETVFALFKDRGTPKLLTKEVFQSIDEFANADLVRAFEDLESKWRLLVRYTNEGNDWVSLTPEGLTYAGIKSDSDSDQLPAIPHPPKSVA